MDEKQTSYKHMQHRKGSVKCGLKTKVNVPKGAAANKAINRRSSKSRADYHSVETLDSEQKNPSNFKRTGVGTLISRYEYVSAETKQQIPTHLKKKIPKKVISKNSDVTECKPMKLPVSLKPPVVPKPATNPKIVSKIEKCKLSGTVTNNTCLKTKSSESQSDTKSIDKKPLAGVKNGISSFELKSKPLDSQKKFNQAPKPPKPLQAGARNGSPVTSRLAGDSVATSDVTPLIPAQSSGSSQLFNNHNIPPTREVGHQPRKYSEGSNLLEKPPLLPPRKMSGDIVLSHSSNWNANGPGDKTDSGVATPELPPRLGRCNRAHVVGENRHKQLQIKPTLNVY